MGTLKRSTKLLIATIVVLLSHVASVSVASAEEGFEVARTTSSSGIKAGISYALLALGVVFMLIFLTRLMADQKKR